MATRFLLVSLLIFALSAVGTWATVTYTAVNNAWNTPGGRRFNRELGVPYTEGTLASSTHFVWQIFNQASPADRRNVHQVSLSIDNMGGISYTVNNQIHVSASFIASCPRNIKQEFEGVVYYEVARVWQWDGAGQAPRGLVEGIADYVRLKAGYIPRNWVKPGQGKRWDAGHDVTARFLDYCNGLKYGFVADLNRKLRYGYSDYFFVQLLGKRVDQLWHEYKVKYGKPY